MKRPRTYTLAELEELSGVNKRTIAYYVEQSLLPRVGRRGPRTRYSQEFLDRLMFICRVRELQDEGQLRAVTLNEIRDVMDQQSAEEIRRAAGKRSSAEKLRGLFAEPDRDTSQLAVRAEDLAAMQLEDPAIAQPNAPRSAGTGKSGWLSAGRRRSATASRDKPPAPRSARVGRGPQSPSTPSVEEDEQRLKELLAEVDRRSRQGAKPGKGQTRERLTRVPVTETMFLSVQDLDEEDAELVEQLAEVLRRLGRV